VLRSIYAWFSDRFLPLSALAGGAWTGSCARSDAATREGVFAEIAAEHARSVAALLAIKRHAALLDDAMGMLFLSLGKGTGFTANLSVDYRSPIPHGTELHVAAFLDRTEVSQKSGATKVYLRAEVRGAASNKLFAEGRALFVVKPPQLGMLLAGALGVGGK
jgi:hypothetical protein